MIRGVVRFGVWGCLLLSAGGAAAVALETHGPEECPDAGELAFRVERNLKVALAQAPPVKFAIEMDHSAVGYVAHISVSGAGQREANERVLSGTDCSQLADAIVVAVTLALGASEEPLAAEPVRAEPARGESRAEPPAVPPTSDAGSALLTIEPASRALRPSLSLAVLIDAGSLPAPGLGAALGAELGWGRLQLRALGTVLFEQHTNVPSATAPAPGADLQLFAGSLLACTTPLGGGPAELSLPVCLGFELGKLAGVGTGVAQPRSGSALWAAPRVDAGARWTPAGGVLSIGVTFTGATPLSRSRFALNEIGTVYQPPSVVGRLSLSVALGFD